MSGAIALTEAEKVPCRICSQPTAMLGTKLCDRCWELETRIRRDPEIAHAILATVSDTVRLPELSDEATRTVVQAILDALPGILVPEDYRDRLKAVVESSTKRLEKMSWESLLVGGLTIEDVQTQHPEFDREHVLRVVAERFLYIGCFLVRSMKRRAHSDIVPARVAIIVYSIAQAVLQQEWDDGISRELVGDGGSLREFLREEAEHIKEEERTARDGQGEEA